MQEERDQNAVENKVLLQQMEELKEINKTLQSSEKRLRKMVEVETSKNKLKWLAITSKSSLTRTVIMGDFRSEKDKDLPGDWKTPPMYTHLEGYKYCLGVGANGREDCRGVAASVLLYLLPGEFDDELEWPAIAKFSVKLSYSSDEFPYTTPALNWDKLSSNEVRFLVLRRLKPSSTAYVKHQSLIHIKMANKLYISCEPTIIDQ